MAEAVAYGKYFSVSLFARYGECITSTVKIYCVEKVGSFPWVLNGGDEREITKEFRSCYTAAFSSFFFVTSSIRKVGS